MAASTWSELGVRPETVEGWEALGFDPFDAALSQGDGFGPDAAHHHAAGLRAVAAGWRGVGMASAEGLRWHRAGFAAREAARWRDRGVDLDAAALVAGHRMVG